MLETIFLCNFFFVFERRKRMESFLKHSKRQLDRGPLLQYHGQKRHVKTSYQSSPVNRAVRTRAFFSRRRRRRRCDVNRVNIRRAYSSNSSNGANLIPGAALYNFKSDRRAEVSNFEIFTAPFPRRYTTMKRRRCTRERSKTSARARARAHAVCRAAYLFRSRVRATTSERSLFAGILLLAGMLNSSPRSRHKRAPPKLILREDDKRSPPDRPRKASSATIAMPFVR